MAAAISAHFDGDASLYEAFASLCTAQFALDAEIGQTACDAADLPALRRLAHDLRSVLLVLGHARLSSVAKLLEAHAADEDLGAAVPRWRTLRLGLLSLASPPSRAMQ